MQGHPGQPGNAGGEGGQPGQQHRRDAHLVGGERPSQAGDEHQLSVPTTQSGIGKPSAAVQLSNDPLFVESWRRSMTLSASN